MMNKFLILLGTIGLSCGMTSCSAPARFYDETYTCADKELTLGLAQKEICKGMSQADVAIQLGSPNIVSKDQSNKETWIYDKIATEVRASSTSGLFLFLSRGCDQVGRVEKSQKTLTVVIKFGEDSLVETMTYHSSKF